MEIAILGFIIVVFAILAAWDSQYVPIRIISRMEYKETFVYTVGLLKWPILFKRKVYFIKDKKAWVIPSKQSVLEPTLCYSEIEEAYIVWRYKNHVD